uniref:DUF1725 domain-containing protein n=1 Tax=Sus scrofa TaxID=9823 RepID=A0A8D1JYU5_PIG
MFIAALFTVAKTWKQPKGPSTDEWIKKMWYIYTMGYYSAITKNKIMPFAATCMELEILILSELGQKEKDKYHTLSLICEILSMAQMILSTKQKQIMDMEGRLVVARGAESGMGGEFGIGGCKL